MVDNEYTLMLKSDFRNFAFRAWQVLGLPEPAVVQYDICDFLQNGPKRRMIQAMRGAGKSYLTATYTAWRLYCNPDTTILCVSAVQTRAREFILLVRRLLDSMEELEHLRPGEWDRDGADRFDVGCRTTPSKNPSVAAYGIKSMITGTHVDVIINDDVEIVDNSRTVEARDTLMHRLREFENVLNPGGDIIYLGTPQTEDSVYNRLAEHYECRRWPARYPNPADERQMVRLAPLLLDHLEAETARPGDPTYPTYYPDELLVEREAIMGPSMFALQMLLDTTLSDADRYPLRLGNLIVWDMATNMAPMNVVWGTTSPANIECAGLAGDRWYNAVYMDQRWAEYENSIMYIDPSGRGEDQTGYCVARVLNGIIHIVECDGLEGGHSDDALVKLATIAAQYGVKTVVVESNWGDGMYGKLLQPHLARLAGSVAVEEKRNKGQKELRIIDTLEPAMAQHRICVSTKVARNATLGNQLSRITRDKDSLRHDDQVEAMAGAVAWYKDLLVLSSGDRVDTLERLQMEKVAKEFVKEWSNPNPSRFVLPISGGMFSKEASREWQAKTTTKKRWGISRLSGGRGR
jgi:predicted phage terminase large subunit-like protein